MARTDNLSNFLTDVADAIRTKTGETDSILASDFDTEIANIPTGGVIYDGAYTVTPLADVSQTLATKNKTMTDDVTINKVPSYAVDNAAGGQTFTIAEVT